MFHLNVRDHNDDVSCLSLCGKTDVGHDTCMSAAFHKPI